MVFSNRLKKINLIWNGLGHDPKINTNISSVVWKLVIIPMKIIQLILKLSHENQVSMDDDDDDDSAIAIYDRKLFVIVHV